MNSASSRQGAGLQTSAPLLIALTGGIASGKSAAAEFFAKFGAPVFDTDQIARDVVEPGTPALARLVETFGSDILLPSGCLDRSRLREQVFADPKQRQLLESITHPAIREELARRSAAVHANQPDRYQVHVIPLLVEGGRANVYDRVLVLDCPREQQLERLLARDGVDPQLAERILAAQASREQRLAAADDVIVNTGSLAELAQFVLTLHKNYQLLAQMR